MSAVEEQRPDKRLGNVEWQAREGAAIARGQGNVAPVFIERGENAELWDVEGKRYIDFGTGIAVCNTGHSNPKVVAAVREQLDKFSHTCVLVTPYDTAVRLAEKLNALAPGESPKKFVFVTTGGAMMAIELVQNGDATSPAVALTKILVGKAYEKGLVLLSCGVNGNVVRFLPALTITNELIDEGLDILEACIDDVSG